jgi:hypothetical protein
MKRIAILFMMVFSLSCAKERTDPLPVKLQVKTTSHDSIWRTLQKQPKRPIKIDTRSDAQLAQAACERSDGSWACPALHRQVKSEAVSYESGEVKPSWSIPDWYFDPFSTVSCASDMNSGTSATCSGFGIGPVIHYEEIRSRWGGDSPILSQPTNLHQLSDQGAPWGDPITPMPILVGDGSFTITGSLVPTGTATVGTYTAKNRATGTRDTVQSPGMTWTAFAGQLANDTTANGWFWVDTSQTGDTTVISNPVQSTIGFGLFDIPAYVTIANGDALTFYRGVNSYIGRIGVEAQGTTVSWATLQNLTLSGPSGPLFGVYQPGNFASMTVLNQVKIGNQIIVLNQGQSLQNSYVDSVIYGGTPFANAGVFSSSSEISTRSSSPAGVQAFDGDVLIECTRLHIFAPAIFGRVYLATVFDTDQANGGSYMVGISGSAGYNYPDSELWGPAHLDMHDSATMVCYGTCASQLLVTGGLTLSGGLFSQGVPWIAATSGYGAPQDLTPANLDSSGGLFNPRTGDGFRPN